MASPSPAAAAFQDDAVYGQRYHKAAAGLRVLHEALDARRPLGSANEAAFLAQVAWLKEQPDEPFARVWQDPTAYWWVRNGYHLMAVLAGTVTLTGSGRDLLQALGADTPAAALDLHLGQFSRFVLGVAAVAGTDRALDPGLAVSLPFAIPGTHWVLDGDQPVRILGISGGAVDVATERDGTLRVPLGGHAKAGSPGVHEAVTIAMDGHSLALLPELYNNLPGLGFTRALDGVGDRFQRDHADLLTAALEAMGRYAPGVRQAFLDHTWSVALKPLTAGDFTNMAHSELPGTFIAAAIPNALEMADTLIHEFHHHHLFFLEEAGPFFRGDGPDPLEDARFYSPWRPDPRPLHGILHGAFVYTPVNDFWLQALRSGDLQGEDREYALDRLGRGLAQIHLGLRQLERHGVLTGHGQRVVAAIGERLGACLAAARAMGLPDAAEIAARRCEEQGHYTPVPGGAASLAEDLRRHVIAAATPAARAHALEDLDAILAGGRPVPA